LGRPPRLPFSREAFALIALRSLDGATEADIHGIKQAMEKRPFVRAAIPDQRAAISAVNAVTNYPRLIVVRPLKSPEFGSRLAVGKCPSDSSLRNDSKLIGGEGGIRTHVPELPDHPISSRRRYDHFGTSPVNLKTTYLLNFKRHRPYILLQCDAIISRDRNAFVKSPQG
jgi:hypothetical protein